ncbi:MAG TPA: FtsX-like permease family protein [Thioploca sp.]|nr:FtsX-like permease family protein [Thioploca sp.]
MRLSATLKYIPEDIWHYRGRHEMFLGLGGILFATATLLILLALSSTVQQIVDRSLEQARPILGVLEARSQGATLTDLQTDFLTQLAVPEPSASSPIEAVSLISQDFGLGFDIWSKKPNPETHQPDTAASEAGQPEILTPTIIAVKPGDPMLDPAYGITYFKGGRPFEETPQWQFEIIVNARFLEEGLKLSPAEIEHLKTGQEQLNVWIEFLEPFAPKHPQLNISWGIIPIPVTGIVDIPDSTYPDIWFHYDVARAYYYNSFNYWHPSFVMPFVDKNGQPLVDYAYSETNPKQPTIIRRSTQEVIAKLNSDHTLYRPLPTPQPWDTAAAAKEQPPSQPASALKTDDPDEKVDKTFLVARLYGIDDYVEHFRAFLWLRDYKVPESHTQVKEAIKAQYQSYLNQKRDTYDSEDKEETKKQKLYFEQLDYTLTQALNRISPTIDLFVISSAVILVILSVINMSLFGMGFVWRKRQDIGLLRACGMKTSGVVRLFLAEITTLTVIGIIIGILIAYSLSWPLGFLANWYILEAIPPLNFEGQQIIQKQLLIQGLDIVKTGLVILGASLLGAIIPTWKVTQVEPIEQLRTQL